jgi:predicted outer membrane repeat protein
MRKPTQRHRSPIEAIEPRLLLSTTIYVDANASSPTHDGTSWPTAFTDLQQALAIASAGDEIHVADGVYKPTSGTDRTVAFQLKNGVQIFGGFAGSGAADPDLRDPGTQVTTLSGDIGVVGSPGDNSNSVVSAGGVDLTALIDGFTITAAGGGGAIDSLSGCPTISNCVVTGSSIFAIRIRAASPLITHCIFDQNAGTYSGGAIRAFSNSSPTITGCSFSENLVVGRNVVGGAVYCDASTAIVSDCSFVRNTASAYGGAIAGNNAALLISNCQFSRNSSANGGAVRTNGGTTTITGCSFTENSASSSGGAVAGSDSQWTITNSTFVRNAADDGASQGSGGALACVKIYQRVNTCTDCRFYGNRARLDGGVGGFPAEMLNCVFVGNSAGRYGSISNSYLYLYSSTAVANIGGTAPDTAVLRSAYSSILWKNQDTLRPTTSSYSDFDFPFFGTGNRFADPKFVRNPSPGADGVWGTSDDDYGDLRLRPESPLIDAGRNDDASGVILDAAGNPRFVDLATVPDTGVGAPPIMDIGAYELQPGVYASIGSRRNVAGGTDLILPGFGASSNAGPLDYAWDLDADGQFDDASGPNAVIPTAGLPQGTTLSVSLRVTDSRGQAATDSSLVTVVGVNLYVDSRATGGNTGASWTDAMNNLAQAMEIAGMGQTIKVAAGTYRPTSTSDRLASFVLYDQIRLQGGYAGAASPTPDARNPLLYPTTLSGDIGQIGDSSDNSMHIVSGNDLGTSTLIDGFTFTGASATGLELVGLSSALSVRNSKLTITHCLFTANQGAAFASGDPVFDRCEFIRNSSGLSLGSGGQVINSSFYGNLGTAASGVSASFVGCVFVGNGNGCQIGVGSIVNCTVTYNLHAGIMMNSSSGVIANTISWANPRDISVSGFLPNVITSTIGNDPLYYRNPGPGTDRTWGTLDDDYGDLRLRFGTPCFDVAENGMVPANVTTDFAGNPRFVDVPGQRDPGAIVDVGAYERVAPFADPAFLVDGPGPAVQVVFGFDVDPASLDAGDLLLTNVTSGQPVSRAVSVGYDVPSRTATWTLTGPLPDGNYRATLPAASVTDTNGSPALGANLSFDFFALAGDANRDRVVDVNDLSILAMNWQGSGKVFSQGDFNYDGKVDAKDLGILSTHWQQMLPPPAAPVRAPVRTPTRVAALVL